jgi:hypothetical protein
MTVSGSTTALTVETLWRMNTMESKKEITGGLINQKQPLNEYPEDDDSWDEARLDIIGQNGPTGLHYEGIKDD